jgi:hypothetical protein
VSTAKDLAVIQRRQPHPDGAEAIASSSRATLRSRAPSSLPAYRAETRVTNNFTLFDGREQEVRGASGGVAASARHRAQPANRADGNALTRGLRRSVPAPGCADAFYTGVFDAVKYDPQAR